MSLKPLLNAMPPSGLWDAVDSELTTFVGGEVCFLKYISDLPSFDEAAADVFDGYMTTVAGQVRPAVSKAFGSSYSATGPLFLADDGIFGYGTMFGSVVGGMAGQQSYGPAQTPAVQLGPTSALASGKVTCWSTGLYAISLSALDGYLQPTNTSLVGGQPLTFTAAGLLTPVGSANALSGAPAVGHLVEFTTNGSLVTTPQYMKSAVLPRQFSFATIWFAPLA